MNEPNNNRTKWLHVRLREHEYERLQGYFKNTTCRKLSEYVRKKLLDKPVVTTYRNQSLDDFMAEMIQLRIELNRIGNNFNQAVKRLHSLQQTTEFKCWLIAYDNEKKILLDKVEEIKNHIQKIAETWLQ
ncbi:MAG: plasmid mobilization protein [Chitinophagaceae bacterium]